MAPSRIFLTNPELTTEAGPIPRHSLGLSVGRSLGEGMHEDLDIANYGSDPAQFKLEFAIRCDFADLFEVKANKIVRRGRISTSWSSAKAQLTTKYRNHDFSRSVSVLVSPERLPSRVRQRPLEFPIARRRATHPYQLPRPLPRHQRSTSLDCRHNIHGVENNTGLPTRCAT